MNPWKVNDKPLTFRQNMQNRPGFYHPDYLVVLVLVATIAGVSALMVSQLRQYGFEGLVLFLAILAIWVGFLASIAVIAFASKPFFPSASFIGLFVTYSGYALLVLFLFLVLDGLFRLFLGVVGLLLGKE